jgi:hypothetical protein
MEGTHLGNCLDVSKFLVQVKVIQCKHVVS